MFDDSKVVFFFCYLFLKTENKMFLILIISTNDYIILSKILINIIIILKIYLKNMLKIYK